MGLEDVRVYVDRVDRVGQSRTRQRAGPSAGLGGSLVDMAPTSPSSWRTFRLLLLLDNARIALFTWIPGKGEAQSAVRRSVEPFHHHHGSAVDMANNRPMQAARRPEFGMHDELALTCRVPLQTKPPSRASPQHCTDSSTWLPIPTNMLFPVRILHRACLPHSPPRYTIGHMAYLIPQVRSPGSKRGCRRATD